MIPDSSSLSIRYKLTMRCQPSGIEKSPQPFTAFHSHLLVTVPCHNALYKHLISYGSRRIACFCTTNANQLLQQSMQQLSWFSRGDLGHQLVCWAPELLQLSLWYLCEHRQLLGRWLRVRLLPGIQLWWWSAIPASL